MSLTVPRQARSSGIHLTPQTTTVPSYIPREFFWVVGGRVLAIAAGLFAYGGWHMVTYAAGETKDAQRTIPRALLIGTLVVTACYAGLNWIYLRMLPLDMVRASSRVAADAADVMFGGNGAARH